MLLALGSFAYKYYSLSPSHPHATIMEENIIKLMNKIEVKSLKITPLEYECECYSLYHEPSFTLSFFVMKVGHFMPLHDHPNMTVFIKLLQGELLLSTYQFSTDMQGHVESRIDSTGRELLKCKKITRIITPDSPHSASVLKPSGPTIHSFRALSDQVVFLDIIGPPYDDGDRNCTYYTDVSESEPFSDTLLPPSLLSASSSSSNAESCRSKLTYTLSNGAVLNLDTDVTVWIYKANIVYECFSKHYEPHQT